MPGNAIYRQVFGIFRYSWGALLGLLGLLFTLPRTLLCTSLRPLLKKPIHNPHHLLLCWVLDDEPNNLFTVKISGNETIHALKEAVKEKQRPAFDHIVAGSLRLYKVSISRDAVNTIDLDYLENLNPLQPSDLVSQILYVPHAEIICIVPRDGVFEEVDGPGDPNLALKEREKGARSLYISLPVPSLGTSSFKGVCRVVRAKNGLHAGRPSTNFGPPVPLFNHSLGLFDYHLRGVDNGSSTADLPLTQSLIEATHDFMRLAAESYESESMRVAAIKNIIAKICDVELVWHPDRFGIQPDAVNVGNTPYLIVEVKNEAGMEGDASLQAALSYAKIVSSGFCKDFRERTNCPAVLYGITGNLLEIGVATYTDGPYYNLLFSERLYLGFYTERNLLRLARAFAATRRVLADLHIFYLAAPTAQVSIKHLFPSPTPVPTYPDFVPSLTFTHRLSRSGKTVVAKDETTRQSGIYLATMARPFSADEDTVMSSCTDTVADTSEVPVVVKFTAQYNPEAHRLIADRGLAPVLHACVPVCGGLFMVVMDLVDGETAWNATQKPQPSKFPYDVYKDIETAIKELHSKDFVFCDLRTPNIMIVTHGSDPDSRPRGMLIDFDCVGKHGTGRYPASLNDDLPELRLSGIQRYGTMDKAHDRVMLERFKKLCHMA